MITILSFRIMEYRYIYRDLDLGIFSKIKEEARLDSGLMMMMMMTTMIG